MPHQRSTHSMSAPAPILICHWCGDSIHPGTLTVRWADRVFCSQQCNRAHANRFAEDREPPFRDINDPDQ